MQKVYLLYHNRYGVNKNISYINIGIFTSYELAEAAKNSVKDKPGFIDYPNDFYIEEYIIDKDYWEDGFIDQLPLRCTGEKANTLIMKIL